ncbi:hypothetical protein Y032_0077g1097 [Ancylostoma ceylanicum]|uniref:Uncharacterized protein n=1 Tax=Ancylostoma ceylanicum TaxID=53326 RepID=A0A016TUC8_9BILA|nr:hypothetical protein Y032_0077g1097 [Ancylostoma ceylanicum]
MVDSDPWQAMRGKDASVVCPLYHHSRSPALIGKGIKVVTLCDDGSTKRVLQRSAEVLPRYISLTVDVRRLGKLAAKTAGKGPNYGSIRLLHDKAHPLTIRVTREKLLDFE